MFQNALFICMLSGICQSYEFIHNYAPQIYLAKGEQYSSSSIEYFFNYTYFNKTDKTIYTQQNITSPSDVLPFFYGQNITTQSIPVYTLIMPLMNETNPVAVYEEPCNHSLVATYFTFYPYNRGKTLFNTVWDNHVGDWEHLHIYFRFCKPYKIVLSYHAWNTTKDWNDPTIQFVNGTTHPIVYSASGSHGLWFDIGSHKYNDEPPLCDKTSRGDAWNTWNNLEIITPYDWNSARPLDWITQIYRWGDPSSIFSNNCYFGVCRFSDGPTGILDKTEIKQTITNLKKLGYICNYGCLWNSGIY